MPDLAFDLRYLTRDYGDNGGAVRRLGADAPSRQRLRPPRARVCGRQRVPLLRGADAITPGSGKPHMRLIAWADAVVLLKYTVGGSIRVARNPDGRTSTWTTLGGHRIGCQR